MNCVCHRPNIADGQSPPTHSKRSIRWEVFVKSEVRSYSQVTTLHFLHKRHSREWVVTARFSHAHLAVSFVSDDMREHHRTNSVASVNIDWVVKEWLSLQHALACDRDRWQRSRGGRSLVGPTHEKMPFSCSFVFCTLLHSIEVNPRHTPHTALALQRYLLRTLSSTHRPVLHSLLLIRRGSRHFFALTTR